MSKYILGLSFCILAVISFSCNDKALNDEYPYDSVKDGAPFARANSVRFYFIDGNGNGLINPDETSTFPISCNTQEQPTTMPDVPDDYSSGYYNGNWNSVIYDPDEKMYFWQTCAYGDSRQQNYTFYVAYNGTFDKMNVSYRYTDKNVDGGKYYAKIISWKVNGIHVYSDNDGYDKKVFIKKVNGKTIVSLKK